MKDSSIFYSVKIFAFFIRCLPLRIGLWVGKVIGTTIYYFDIKHRAQAYANLKMAFADSKSPQEIKRITKTLFQNYGQNLIELFRLPLMTSDMFEKYVTMEGKANIMDALRQGKGGILLAMHFGSWEMASLSCAFLDHPYKVMVKPQKKYSKLDDLLNSYRACGGSVVLSRGLGTRDLIKSLKNNEVIGMVVDQGGKDGIQVPFFKRQASMSSGAVRLALKLGVPICFSIIIRQNGPYHRVIFHKPLELENTGDLERDIVSNLHKITKIMEHYVAQYPAEYMWFYKIWKYSKEANITIFSDGKIGHLRQSQAVARMIQQALAEREIKSTVQIIKVSFKNKLAVKYFSFLNFFTHPFLSQGRLGFLQIFLKKESFTEMMSMKSDFIVSCGSSVAGVNNLVSRDHNAKSIVILKPGSLSYKKFDLVILPEHDVSAKERKQPNIAITRAAPNLIDEGYLQEQSELLLNRYSHLKNKMRIKIGLLIGGDAKNIYISEHQIRLLVRQVKEIAKEINADILVTTSRRTPPNIEQVLFQKLKKDSHCPLLILANREEVPEAVGGILGLSDILVVSGDSISMVSEAAAAGKKTIVFAPENKNRLLKGSSKHQLFVDGFNQRGFILATNVKDIGQSIYDVAKNKIKTTKLDDNPIILDAVREVI